ncbi:MAG TPA: hypothetical protein VKU42_00405 [Candidatus Angelobacter sp.]|nr:hypothetical protein [Candidatus Angelobacter sp.]
MMSRAATLLLLALVLVTIGSAQAPSGSGNPAQTPNTGTSGQPANAEQISPGSSENSPNHNPTNPNLTADGGLIIAGTEIHATLDTPLSTRTSKPGDRFTATIASQVSAENGPVVIPAGARVEGEVAEAENDKALAALHDKVQLSLRFRDVVLPNGQTLPLTATLISVRDTSGKPTKKTVEEGQPKSVGAGTGTISGANFGDPLKGLAIGALAGGGYVLAIKGKDVNLPAQTGMVIRLDQAVSGNGTSAAIQR